MIKSSIFKSYDVRGIYPNELNEEAAFAIGRAFTKHTGAKNVVVGYDARISSPALFKALTQGLLAEGVHVTSIGQVPTECLYFSVGNYDFDGGIMITASHNPKEYNGFKMMKKGSSHIEWIRGESLAGMVEDGSIGESNVAIEEKEVLEDYIHHLLSFVDIKQVKPFKIVVDASHGVVGELISQVKEVLPLELIKLNFTPDGNFPNHSPNPLEAGSVDQISQKIKSEKAHFGFMFDGDADRIFLVNEHGALVSADVTRLILARHFLQKTPGTVIVYDLICSKAVPEFIAKWGGVPVKSKVGFVNIRETLIEHKGILGGELSNHYCFKDCFYMDSGMMAFLILLQEISWQDKNISDIEKELSIYAKLPTINFEVKDKDAIMEKIKQRYSDGKQDFLDGVTVEYKNWWFNVRPSNTEPLLRLTIEADTQELLEEKEKELSEFINQ